MPVDTFYHHKEIHSIPYTINPETYYTDVFNELKAMLEDKQSLSFKRAVFITENAYYENNFSYDMFCNYISSLAKITEEWNKKTK